MILALLLMLVGWAFPPLSIPWLLCEAPAVVAFVAWLVDHPDRLAWVAELVPARRAAPDPPPVRHDEPLPAGVVSLDVWRRARPQGKRSRRRAA